ncbi:MAG: hypothetical protein IJQ32_02770 [Paludibacteraceae bacterium]|nr:hypothetical protein [Paludibacteraceae bacterium]
MTFVFKHAHAGKISGTKSGSHQSDFTLKTSLPTNSTTQANCTITVAFKPSCGGSRSATLTLTGDNGGSMSISLSGNGVRHTPSISTTNGSVNVSVGSTATPTNLNDRVTCDNTDGAKTYTKANNSDPVTISGSNFSATKAGEYTVNVSVAQTCYYATQTGSFKITVNRLDPTFTATNGEVNVSIDGINSSSLNLADKISYGGNGTVSYKVVSTNKANATISGSSFSATACGDYTIRAVATQTDQYLKDSVEFTVKVNKLQPTFSWAMTGANDHIYAGDVLTNVAQAKYGEASVSGLTYTYSSANTDVVVVDADKTTLRVQSTGFTTAQNVTISVSTEADDYYLAGSDSHTYYIEPKQTPEFYMSGKAIPAENAKCSLMIGDTVHFSFDKVDESKFSTPQSPTYVSYLHNSTDHTGVLTATTAGEETILFSQTGTALINAGSRSVHVYVSRHPVNLTKVLNNGTWKVDSVYTGAVYSITNGDGVHALNTVSVTSSDEKVLKYEDGGWKAVGAGTARLTISHAQTDYWAAEKDSVEITVEKYTPVITWNLEASYPWGAQENQPVVSSNTELPFSVVSDHPEIANYVNGRVEVYNTTGSAKFTLTQAGNYKWNAASTNLTKTISVYKPQNHVPFTLSSTNYTNFKISSSSDCSWDNNCFKLGDGGVNEDDDEVIIHFTGIPKTLSFDVQLDKILASLPGFPDCWVYESATGADNSWSEVWYSDKREEYQNGISKDLQPSTRYIKFKYNGSIYCRYKNISVTERKEVTGANTVDFGTTDAGSDPTEKSTNINWYNVYPLTLTIEGTNASQFTIDKSSIEAKTDSFSENIPLKLTYKHNRAAVKDTATLVISDGTTTKKIGLKGVTNKITPAITWKENLTPMQRGVGVKNPATSPVTLTYSSTDSEVVKVIGDSIVPLKKGTVTITASFDGTNDGVYNSTSSTKDVVVTDVKVQHINWTQNFKRLKWTDKEELSDKNTADFALVATVSYYDVDKEEEITIDRPITFTSNNDEVVQVLNGTTLHVVGTGTTTLEAHVDGITDSLYEATAVRDVIVREPSLDCETWVLEDKSGSINTIDSKEFTLDGEADSIYFDAWREPIKVVIEYSAGDLYLDEVYENGSTKQIWNNSTEKNKANSYKAPLSRNAKKVRFYTQFGAQGYHKFSGVYARRARYVEFEDGKATKNVAFTTEDAKPGVAKEKSVKVKYSNITDQLEFKMKGGENSKFSVVSPAAIGNECGDKGEATVTIKFLSNDVDTYKDTLLIQNLNQTVTVYLEAEVDKHHQQITWNPATTDLKTTDNVTFDATTTGSAAGLSVRYSVTEGSDVASVNATTGALTIVKDGSVTIQVDADGDGATYYDAEPVSKTFTISKVKPTITTDPTAETMTLPNTSLAECDLTDGVASVDGSFDWEDKTIDATYNNSGYKVVFTPDNTNWYDTASCVVVVPVNKQANEITWNFDVTEMFCNAQYAFTGENAATATCGEPAVYYETSDASIAYVDDAKNLKIIKGGSVTITAKQDGNGTYAAATPVSKTILIKRFAPTIVTMPTVAPMKIGRTLSDASLTGGRAELNNIKVEGVFAWVDGNTTVMNEAGTFEKQIVFAPSNTNYYDSVYAKLNVTVEKYAPVLSNNTLSGSTITYGQAVSASTIDGSITATDTVKLPHITVAGNVVWKNASSTYPAAGTPSHATAVFVPTNTDWYNEVEIENVPLTVNPSSEATYAATTTIVYGQRLSEAVLTNATTGVFGETVNGSVAWAEDVDQTAALAIGSHSVAIRFTSSSSNYTDGDGLCAVTVLEGVVFKGNTGETGNSWSEGTNWQNQNMPGTNDRVTVDADVEVSGTVTIGGLTINEGNTVTVKDGATLTIGAQDSYLRNVYGNIHVENGGQLICGTGEVKVKDFILDASLTGLLNADDPDSNKPAMSGQVTGETALKITGDAYFDLALDVTGQCSPGWYDFTVPFPVDVMTGVSRFNRNTGEEYTIRNEVNYAIMDFSESRRVESGYGWKKFRGIMQPGQCYSITIDSYDNVYRFKKTATGSFNYSTSESLAYTEGDNPVRGWNGLGNGTLKHVNLSADGISKVQIYNHSSNSYTAVEIGDYSYVVGSSYFVQALAPNSVIEYSAGTKGTDYLRAPRRAAASENSEFKLSLTREGNTNESDRLYVGASEEATDSYEVGRDLTKFGNPTESKVAQVWANAYGLKLCDIDMPLNNDAAECTLGLFAPQAKTYTLSVERAPENMTLYLTYNGNVVWDLTMSAYEFDLSKGTTEGYGLRIELKKTPAIMTGVDNAEADGQKARKVIIDDQMYIITPEGAMYNVTGKFVR